MPGIDRRLSVANGTGSRDESASGLMLRCKRVETAPRTQIVSATKRVLNRFADCCRWIVAFAVCALIVEPLAAALPPETAGEQAARSPYRIQIELCCERSPELGLAFRRQIEQSLVTALAARRGREWQVQTRLLEPGDVVNWIRSDTPPQPEKWSDTQRTDLQLGDKLFRLGIQSAGQRLTLLGREWDFTTAQWGQTGQAETEDRSQLVSELADLLERKFRAVGWLESRRGQTTVLFERAEQLRAAAGRTAGDPAETESGSRRRLFEPYYRFLKKDLTVDRIQRVPWTYVWREAVADTAVSSTELPTPGVTSPQVPAAGTEPAPRTVDPPAVSPPAVNSAGSDPAVEEQQELSLQVVTGLRAPLTARRYRVEIVALSMQADLPRTELIVRTQRAPQHPIPGLDVIVTDGDGRTENLMTGRQGEVRLTADPEQPLLQIEVRSGKVILGKVPVWVGIRSREVLDVPDDSRRLQAEADLSVLQSQLIDTVAQRAILIAQARKQMLGGSLPAARGFVKTLDQKLKAADFQERLRQIELPAIAACRKEKDRRSEQRIRQLCADTRSQIERFLSEEAVKQLKEELQELEIGLAEAQKEGAAAAKASTKPGAVKGGRKQLAPPKELKP